MRIAVLANTTWYLYNFRLNLMRALAKAGHEVLAVAPADKYVGRIHQAGFGHAAIPLVGSSINPVSELKSVWALYRLFQNEKIAVVLSDTPKGNIYGALASIPAGIPSIANVSGLGRTFISPSPLTWLVKGLYWLAFKRSALVFFQNQEDMDLFVRSGLVPAHKAERMFGVGVDVHHFKPSNSSSKSMVENNRPFTFLLSARLLWDKGIGEYVEAARKIRRSYPYAQFQLMGFAGVDNPSAIPKEQIVEWAGESLIEYLGSTDDVTPFIRGADCVVLPSYREGVPRTLLEAASMAKPIITTDAPGCRDTVEDGHTGYLCRTRDAGDLAEKMLRMIEMPKNERLVMGRNGREKMLREFDEHFIINRYIDVLEIIDK